MTFKKLFNIQPANQVERMMIFILLSFWCILTILDVIFNNKILSSIQIYIVPLTFLTLFLGYKVGRNHDRIEAWLTNLKNKFSKQV